MAYLIKEMYRTLQGEGAHSGRVAVFLRFAGCNLWSGREEDRADAVCSFCDTDFVGTDGPGGGVYPGAEDVVSAVLNTWASPAIPPFVVCTGGEPLLQFDADLINALHAAHATVAIETNGTMLPPPGIDWICVSPKAGADLVLTAGHELKLVFPQPGAEPDMYQDMEFENFFLQPMDGPRRDVHTRLALLYCFEHPQWRLSVQTHKYIGIP